MPAIADYRALLVARVAELLPAAAVLDRADALDADDAGRLPLAVFIVDGDLAPLESLGGSVLLQSGLGAPRRVRQQWQVLLQVRPGPAQPEPLVPLAALIEGLAGWTPPTRAADLIEWLGATPDDAPGGLARYRLLLSIDLTW
ncbi:MAG: hypothetical protein RR101_13835 [Burkholderiaceae bacterium]